MIETIVGQIITGIFSLLGTFLKHKLDNKSKEPIENNNTFSDTDNRSEAEKIGSQKWKLILIFSLIAYPLMFSSSSLDSKLNHFELYFPNSWYVWVFYLPLSVIIALTYVVFIFIIVCLLSLDIKSALNWSYLLLFSLLVSLMVYFVPYRNFSYLSLSAVIIICLITGIILYCIYMTIYLYFKEDIFLWGGVRSSISIFIVFMMFNFYISEKFEYPLSIIIDSFLSKEMSLSHSTVKNVFHDFILSDTHSMNYNSTPVVPNGQGWSASQEEPIDYGDITTYPPIAKPDSSNQKDVKINETKKDTPVFIPSIF